jgi:hypothetical protein
MLLNLEIGSFRYIRQTLKCPPANLIVESLGSLSVHIQGRFSTGKSWHPCIFIALSYSRVTCIHDNYLSHVCTQWREREGYVHGQIRERWKHHEHIGWLHYTLGYGVQNNSSEAICAIPKRYSMGTCTCCSKKFTCRNQGPFFFNKIVACYIGLFVYSLRFFFWIHSFGSFDGYKALILKIFLPAIVYF